MDKIPEFSEDMEIIQKLSDYPEQDLMSTSQFKACFDKAGILIKAFINKHVVPAINNYVASQDGLLKTVGGTMTGDISMSGNKVTGFAPLRRIRMRQQKDTRIINSLNPAAP